MITKIKKSKPGKVSISDIEAAALAGVLTPEAISKLVDIAKAQTVVAVSDVVPMWEEWMKKRHRSSTTVSNRVGALKAWLREKNLSSLPPHAITDDHIMDWVNRSGRVKASTRRSELSIIRSFFMYCSARGLCKGDPSRLCGIDLSLLSHVQKERRPRAVFTEEECSKLIEYAKKLKDTFWYPAISLARYTGLRLSDICLLEWSSMTIPGKLIVWTVKRDVRVELPLEPIALVQAISSIKYVDPVFCFPEKRARLLNSKLRSTISTQFQRICRAVNIYGRNFHDLRSTYCDDMDRKGVPIAHIARSVGHASETTTRKYIPGRK